MALLLRFAIAITICTCALAKSPLSVRIVTWNVLSNKWMGGEFHQGAVAELLGPLPINETYNAVNHDVVVLALQENCFMCNIGNEKKLAEVFLKVLRRRGDYELVTTTQTRNSSSCEWWACNTYQHGTAVLLVFARSGLLSHSNHVKVNKCDGLLIHNAEKGIAGVRTVVRSSGQSICFAGLHLDSKSHANRQDCLKSFWSKARKQKAWRECDSVFMMGDFNTRPGPNRNFFHGSVGQSAFGDEFFMQSKSTDEMTGVEPWGGKRLIDFISKNSGYLFEDDDISFMPTYSIQPKGSCNDEPPCFKGSRQPAWTDRILCANCDVLFYDSRHLGVSDHDPVLGVFEV